MCRSPGTMIMDGKKIVTGPSKPERKNMSRAKKEAKSSPATCPIGAAATLEGVQRELSSIKVERRRRQEQLYAARRGHDAHTTSCSTMRSSRPDQLKVATSPGASMGEVSSAATHEWRLEEHVAERVPFFTPETGMPPQLITMAYISQRNGRLAPSPEHIMGSRVRFLDLSTWVISDEQTRQLCDDIGRVEALKFGGRGDVNAAALSGLSRLGPQLTSLELPRCFEVPPDALGTLLHDAAQLTSLDLSGCETVGDAHVAQVARGCPAVTSLDLSSCLLLTDAGIIAAVVSGGFVHLQRFLVSDCPEVGDSGLEAALNGCLDLRELSASGCAEVTGRAFLDQQLAGGLATAPVRGLRTLNLAHCRQLEASAVEWISAGCTCLGSLNVSGCIAITAEGVELLASTPFTLSHLSVARCLRLGDRALSFVADRACGLQHLDISDIPTTSARVVTNFLQNCGRLEFVDVSGLLKIDSSSFSGLREKRVDAGAGASPAQGGVQVSRPCSSDEVPSRISGEHVARDHEDRAGLPHLRVARMLRLPNMDDSAVISFAGACPRLEELALSDSPNVTGACLAPLSAKCPLLKSLGLDRCGAASDEPALTSALRGLPDLESLGIARQRSESRSSVSGSHGCKNKRRSEANDRTRAPFDGVHGGQGSVNGRGPAGEAMRGTGITGATLLPAASRCCTQLTTLGMEGHERLTFAPDRVPPGAFPCLEELRLTACTAVDDAGLVGLLKACPRIRTLSLLGSSVSQAALTEASEQLRFVDVLPPPPEQASLLGLTPSRALPPPAQTSVNITETARNVSVCRSGGSSEELSTSARCEEDVKWVGASGLRPSKHSELHIAAAATFSRFREEKQALNTLICAWRRYQKLQVARRVTSANRICRAVKGYSFRVNKGHPDQVRLVLAKKAARVIQEHVRAIRRRRRNEAASIIQSHWRRREARIVYLHQQRLRYAARGFQRLWRGYYVRTHFRVQEKVAQLKRAKKMLGPKWFKPRAGTQGSSLEPEALDAEKERRAEMMKDIQRAKEVVASLLLGRAAAAAHVAQEDDDACSFGAKPPPPRREIVRGAFDARPKARNLRDGREVAFAGEALGLPGSPKTHALMDEDLCLKIDRAPCDPPDFDVFMRTKPNHCGWHGDPRDGACAAAATAEGTFGAPGAREDDGGLRRSLCDQCRKRFAGVSCMDCRQAYCMRCVDRVHAQPARSGHELLPFRRPDKPAHASCLSGSTTKGTVDPTSKAKKAAAARSLPGCARRAEAYVKNMGVLKEREKVKMDEQRVKRKVAKRKEMEEEEARQRQAAEVFNQALTVEHDAARLIQKTCQGFMKRLLYARETDIRRRAAVEDENFNLKTAAIRLQALFRGYSVRRFLAQVKPKLALDGDEDKPAITVCSPDIRKEKKETAAARVRRDCGLRRRWEREAAIAEMRRLKQELSRIFTTDLRWAVDMHISLDARQEGGKRRKREARTIWNHLQDEQSRLDPALPPDDPERRRLAQEIALQEIRLQHQAGLVEVGDKALYWCRAFIRQQYRRHAAQLASLGGAEYTLAWLEEELLAVNEVVAFASRRLEGVADVVEQEFFRGWLTDQITRAGKQRLMIDLEQEFLLETETTKLSKAIGHACRCKDTLQELVRAYTIDACLMAERCGAELHASNALRGTDEELKWTARITRLKQKEENVRRKVQTSLQRGLEEEIDTEEKSFAEFVKFTGDVADAPITHFIKIKASLVEPTHHPQHLSFESWKKVYRAQPWLAAQTQAENKRKAARASTIEGLEEMRAVVASAKAQEAFAAKEVALLRAKIQDFEKRLAYKSSEAAGGVPDEPLSEVDRVRLEFDLRQTQEKIEDMTERLERRKKANSHKEGELKKREDELEAEITAEEERHARQAAAMAAFHAAERDTSDAQYGHDEADAALERMQRRMERLKAAQGALRDESTHKRRFKHSKMPGLLQSMVGFILGNDGVDNEESLAKEMDYAEQTAKIAKRAKLALVNRQIGDLEKAKRVIGKDYASADAQLMLAEDAIMAGDEDEEAAKDAKMLQEHIREAKQRAMEAKEDRDNARRRAEEEEAARAAEIVKKEQEAEIARRIAEEMGMGNVGDAGGVLASMRRIKAKLGGSRTVYGGAFDNENAAVEAAIKTRHKAKLGKVEAVVGFAFTVGPDETDAMASKQARLESQGLPYYRKLSKGLGGKDAVFLWVTKSLDSQEFITDLQITNGDPGNRKIGAHLSKANTTSQTTSNNELNSYKNLRPFGYTSYGHPKLAAKDGGQPSLLLWCKKDQHRDGIADVDMSYNQADEKKLSDVGFKLVPGLLSDCGMPDIRLWYSTVKRGAHTLPAMKDILHDLADIRRMRVQNPDDFALAETEARLESKLAQAREADELKAKDAENPLKSSIETYALTAADVDVFIEHFGMMDVERKGTIEIGAFFEYFEWPRNAFANHLFSFMEATDEDGEVDFGDFVKLVCSYCMFGKADLLRYAYTVYDQGKGFMSFDDLISLLNDLHKTNAGPIQRALRDAHLPKNAQLRFNDFLDLDRRFPKMFYPVANLQIEMRKTFLGEAFWVRKMRLFNEARQNILKEADGTANRARNAKLREEEFRYLLDKPKKLMSATSRRARRVANRTREKLEQSKWMSKLLS